MKKFFALFLIAVLFSGCVTEPASTRSMQGMPTRGIWDNNVFTSEYFGFKFNLPPGWNFLTDSEIARALGIADDFFDESLLDIMERMDGFIDMMAVNHATGTNVNISIERHGLRAPTPNSLAEAFTESGGRAVMNSGTTRIGAYDWHSYNTEIDMLNTTMYGCQFVIIENGFIRNITITAGRNESIDSVLQWFTEIS